MYNAPFQYNHPNDMSQHEGPVPTAAWSSKTLSTQNPTFFRGEIWTPETLLRNKLVFFGPTDMNGNGLSIFVLFFFFLLVFQEFFYFFILAHKTWSLLQDAFGAVHSHVTLVSQLIAMGLSAQGCMQVNTTLYWHIITHCVNEAQVVIFCDLRIPLS